MNTLPSPPLHSTGRLCYPACPRPLHSPTPRRLRWVNYERLLEEAVLYYRSGGASGGKRVPVGEAFITTHSFADEVLDGEYEARVRDYEEKKESLLAQCRKTVRTRVTWHFFAATSFQWILCCGCGR